MNLMVPGPPSPNDAKSRVGAREAARDMRAQEALEQTRRARFREKPSIQERVESVRAKLVGRNVQDTILLMEGVSDQERDIFLIAEETGQARKSIFARFGKPRKTVRNAYLSAVGLETRDQSADEAAEE